MLRDMVRGLCAEFSPLERVRELEDDPDGIARDLWQRFGDLGLCGLMVPESAGGAGMSLLDGVVVYEELGRSLAPLPHFVSLRAVRSSDRGDRNGPLSRPNSWTALHRASASQRWAG